MPPLLRTSVEKYSYFNGRGDRVLCWDHSRFVNHSCNATSLAPGFDLEIAVRDIQEGEEITDDYGLLNLDTSFECACGWEHCRGTIGPEDFEAHAARWDGLAVDAMRHFQRVDQPLWELVHEKDAIQAVLEGRAPLPSCRVHRMQALRAEAAVA
jgi:hypothetical protein